MPLTSFVDTKVSDNEYSENVNTKCEIHGTLQLVGFQFSGLTLLRLAYVYGRKFIIQFRFFSALYFIIKYLTRPKSSLASKYNFLQLVLWY